VLHFLLYLTTFRCILKADIVGRVVLNPVWDLTRSVEESDFLASARPLNLLMRIAANVVTPRLKQMHGEMHNALRERGVLIGWGESEGRGPIGHLGLLYVKLGGFCELYIRRRLRLLTITAKVWMLAAHSGSSMDRSK
jgi:hypothetical protein